MDALVCTHCTRESSVLQVTWYLEPLVWTGTALGSLDAWQGCFSISSAAFSRQALDTRLPRYYYCISWTHQYFSNVLLDWAQNSLLVHHYGLKCEPSPTKNAIEREKKSSSLQAFKKSRKEKVKYIKKCKKKRITEKTNYGKIVLAIFNHNFKRPKQNLFGSIWPNLNHLGWNFMSANHYLIKQEF